MMYILWADIKLFITMNTDFGCCIWWMVTGYWCHILFCVKEKWYVDLFDLPLFSTFLFKMLIQLNIRRFNAFYLNKPIVFAHVYTVGCQNWFAFLFLLQVTCSRFFYTTIIRFCRVFSPRIVFFIVVGRWSFCMMCLSIIFKRKKRS